MLSPIKHAAQERLAHGETRRQTVISKTEIQNATTFKRDVTIHANCNKYYKIADSKELHRVAS